jgi:hypothetical protein
MANNYPANNNGVRPAGLVTAEQLKSLEEVAPEVSNLVKMLRMMLPNVDKLTDAQIVAAAVYGKETGLDPISGQFYVTKEQGVMPGYKGQLELAARKTRYNYRHRPMTQEERDLHGVGAQDWASICVFTDIDTAVEMRRLNLEYAPTEGVGIVRYEEVLVKERWEGDYGNRRKITLPRDQWAPRDAPVGKSWHWVAEKRALKDACNHVVGFEWMSEELSETADDILALGAADIPGFNYPPDSAKLSKEQARAWVEKERHAARLRTDATFTEQRMAETRVRGETNTLRRAYEDWQMATMDCPHCGAPERTRCGDHWQGCPFNDLAPHSVPPVKPATVAADDLDGDYRIVEEGDDPADDFDAMPAAMDELDINAARADAALLEHVRSRLQLAAREGDPAPPDERTLKHARGSMSNLFGRDDEARKAVIKWAFGVNSSSDMTAGMCRDLIDFIGSTKAADEWVPSDKAIEFLRAFKRAVMGQQELL